MTWRLYKRGVQVTIARVEPGKFFTTTEELAIRDLRVTFDITKATGETPNTAAITVYNFSERTRAELQRKPLQVRLDAGYDGQLSRLFVGDLVWCSHEKQGPDWLTKLQLGDGASAYADARISRSYPRGVNVRDVLNDLVSSMGLSMPDGIGGFSREALEQGPGASAQDVIGQFNRGVALGGPSSREMTKILKRHGMEWSIQDGRLQILADGTGLRPDEVLVVSQDTGMIGSPTFAAPKDDGTPATLTVKTLLRPELTPGGRVAVQSRAINGIFRLVSVKHAGDTHGTDWTSELEATAA
jgi:hypothetical protein